MNPAHFPCDYAKTVGGVATCPELEDALRAGRYIEGGDWGSDTARLSTYGPVEDIGRHREPGRRPAYVYRLQSCRTPAGETWWRAFGEYCEAGRTTSDADYAFLDGGGYFSSRAAALWAIHLWLAHLHRADALGVVNREIHHGA